MAVKTAARKATKPRSAKRAARRATRRAARKARRVASKPKAPKAARKVTKSRKPSRRSQIGTKAKVWNGTKKYTKSGLMKKDLLRNKHGKIITRKQYKMGQKLKKSPWVKACIKARKMLGLKGFVPLNKGVEGKAYYKLAKSFM